MKRADSQPVDPEGIELPPFLPITQEEALKRGWEELDIVIVTGDAYVDHPSFAPALLGRILEDKGFRVGIIARPRTNRLNDFTQFGKPRLFFAVSTGSVDSMINNYTAQKRRRRDDSYAPGGRGGTRPDRALIVYCNMLRRAFGNDVAILGGGVEASLRRFAHYDFWDDAVRRSVILDAPADTLVYGMGERPLVEIALAMRSRMARQMEGLTASEALASVVRQVNGAVYRSNAAEPPPSGYHALPAFSKVRDIPNAMIKAFRDEVTFRANGVYQDCGDLRVVANPPSEPLGREEIDRVYDLRFRRQAHVSYAERVPALEQVQFSITSHRGCFGGCAFCGIFTHQGKIVQSRSCNSILREVEQIVRHPEFQGTLRDIGGPTANMWGLSCKRGTGCLRPSCLAPKICRYLDVDQQRYLDLLRSVRKVPGVTHLFVSSGIRMDLALRSEPFIDAIAKHYTSGHAKVAPEHVVPQVLEIMMKPDGAAFIHFLEKFRRASSRAGKEQYVLPYFIVAHPGCRVEDMIEVALFLKSEHLRVKQCQTFTPIPGTASAVMYATGINPFTNQKIFVERDTRRRDMQKALLLYQLPPNARLVREALALCGRSDLISVLLGGGRHHSRGGPSDKKEQGVPERTSRSSRGGKVILKRHRKAGRTRRDGLRTTDSSLVRTKRSGARKRTNSGNRRKSQGYHGRKQ